MTSQDKKTEFSIKNSKSPSKNLRKKSIAETEKVKILLSQLKNANDKWVYMEERRLKTFELFLSYSGISIVGVLFTKIEAEIVEFAQFVLPLLFSAIGWIFFIIFWYREYYYQLTKSWCKRIEQELQIIYKGEQYRREKEFDGAYRLYYYRTNFDSKDKKFNDWSSYILGGSIAFTTIVVSLITYLRFNFDINNPLPCKVVLTIIIALLVFLGTREIILSHLNKMYAKNSDQWPPSINNKVKNIKDE